MIKMLVFMVASAFILRFGAIEQRPPLFYKRVQFTPNAHDSVLWKLDEKCLGRRANMNNVKFYYLPSKKSSVYDKEDSTYIRAYVYWPDSSINLLERFRADSQIERHEMIHIIARMSTHDSATFEGKCGIPILDYRQFPNE